MARFGAADLQREQFRRYLEKGNVLDMLTKVLVILYEEPEKPNNIMDFLKQHLAIGPEPSDVLALQFEMIELRQKYQLQLEQNKELKAKLAQFELPKEVRQTE